MLKYHHQLSSLLPIILLQILGPQQMKRKDKGLSQTTLKQLLEAGAHFGHQTRRWNPKMGRYIYGARGGIHIIDLTKTGECLQQALEYVERTTASGAQVLFVGTKRQGKAIIKAQAEAAGMPYVAERWLGGMLTNFQTIGRQVSRLKELRAKHESGELESYSKKEQSGLREEMERLELIFGGISAMEGLPAAVFVSDAKRDEIAIAEAKKLGLKVIAINDTNTDPSLVDYPIPANDDAVKALAVIIEALATAAAAGHQRYQAAAAKEAEKEAAEAAKEAARVAKQTETEAAAKTKAEVGQEGAADA